MKIISNYSTTHLDVFKKLSELSDEIIIVSPFCYQDFDDFFQEVLIDKIKMVTLLTTLKPEDAIYKSNSLVSFVDGLNSRNINWTIKIDNKLHGKIYLFLRNNLFLNAIITSANITDNGMRKNHEWGYLIDDVDEIKELYKQICAGIEVQSLSEDKIIELMLKVDEYIKTHQINSKVDNVEIGNIIGNITGITYESETRFFLKPIGSSEKRIFDGDFSDEDELYFSKRRPNSVRIDDLLICYAVGATKLISVFKVLSEPIYTNNDNPRWPWYVNAINLTPEYGKNWFKYDNTLAAVYSDYLKRDKENFLTYNGGKTLGALNFGADKIRLNDDFGKFLIKTINDAPKNYA